MKVVAGLSAVLALAAAGPSLADLNYTVKMYLIDAKGPGKAIGEVVVTPGQQGRGVAFAPALTGLPPGDHGFHVHQNPSCGAAMKEGRMEAGEAAGPHYDPAGAAKHAGPTGGGHKGDLPVLKVSANGAAGPLIVADNLTWPELKGRSLVIHAGGDTYTEPPANGGGGARIACGVIQQ
jgi:Cu-Zn family superoxide dismutase